MKRLTIPEPVRVPGAFKNPERTEPMYMSLRDAFDKFVVGQPMWRNPKQAHWRQLPVLLDALRAEAKAGDVIELADDAHESLQLGFQSIGRGEPLDHPWGLVLSQLAGAVFSAAHVANEDAGKKDDAPKE